MDTILITGGAGFVGSSLALGIAEAGIAKRIVTLDNLTRRGSELNLPRLDEAKIEFRKGDVRMSEDIADVGPVDLIIDCSAEPSVLAGYDSGVSYLVDTNLGGTINCLEHARKHDAALLFLSTSRVYPIAPLNTIALSEAESRFEIALEQTLPGVSSHGISEAFPLDGPRSLYGATKLASEIMIQDYLAAFGLKGVVNRCGVIAGPWQMGKVDQGVISLWIAQHLYGGALKYIGFGGEGKQVRDVLHVEDLLRLVLHQIEHLDTLSGRTFNVGGGHERSVSLCELTEICARITGESMDIGCESETRQADVPLYITDNQRVTAETGWAPSRTIEDVCDEVTRWMRDHRATLEPIFAPK